jgi:hypothetical protein
MTSPLSFRLAFAAASMVGLLQTTCRDEPRSRAAGWKLDSHPAAWKVVGFEGSLDLSGAASIDDQHCLIASDELPAVQIGRIDRTARVITAGALVPLVKNPLGKKIEIDIEGVAVSKDGQTYYVMGSHGVGKMKGDVQPQRYLVFEIPFDPASGTIATEEIKSASLLPWLERSPEFAPFVKQSLQSNGFNLEGLAFREGRLFFGVRNPNVKGTSYVIETDAARLFSGSAIQCVVHRLPLGKRLGIRDLVVCRDGFLFLAGNASAEPSKRNQGSKARRPDTRFELGLWRPEGRPGVSWLGDIPSGAGKAEALLVLEERAEYIDFLCLSDGLVNGGPEAYRLHRPPPAAVAPSLVGEASPRSPKATSDSIERYPAPVRETIEKSTKPAAGSVTVVRTLRQGDGTVYLADILRDSGYNLKLHVEADGSVIKSTEEMPLDTVPALVRKALLTLAAEDGLVEELKKITEGTTITYKAEIDRAGKAEVDVTVAPDGTILTQKEDEED